MFCGVSVLFDHREHEEIFCEFSLGFMEENLILRSDKIYIFNNKIIERKMIIYEIEQNKTKQKKNQLQSMEMS